MGANSRGFAKITGNCAMDKEKRDPSMKKAKIMAVIAMILIFAAFASLGIGAILQGDGVAEGIVVPTALVGFFGCSMIKRLFGV